MTEESNQALLALAAMGLTPEEIDNKDASKANQRGHDKRICMCGHAMDRHKVTKTLGTDNVTSILRSNDVTQPFTCTPNRRTCSCKTLYPVLEVSNTKYFLKKTTGSGELHALTRGIRSLSKVKDNTITWLVQPACLLCGAIDGADKIVPAVFNKDRTVRQIEGSIGYDDFLCQKCRTA